MSWSSDSWASSGGNYSDTLIAVDTLEQSYDDYSGRAVFYKSASDSEAVGGDLIITSLEYTINEHIKVEQAVGNCFMYVAFGKDALQLNLSAFLVDSGKNPGKDTFMDFYKNYLRMEAVARRGTTPILVFPNAAFYCAANALTLSETSESEDLVAVTLTLQVTAAVFTSTEYNFMLDYVHGVEVSGDSILNTELTTDSSATGANSTSASQVALTTETAKNTDTSTSSSSSITLPGGPALDGSSG